MDKLWYGLQVAVVGMVVVFVGLIILIGCIKALSALGRRSDTPQTPGGASQDLPPAPAQAAQTASVPPAPAAPREITYTPGPLLTRKDDAFYAVLTAAVAATLEAEGVNPDGGFAIRSVKAINEPKPGPALTQKDDAFWAVITAAIAKTLEAEGINPEGGFAIRSVKAL